MAPGTRKIFMPRRASTSKHFACCECYRTFTTQFNLNRHLRKHSPNYDNLTTNTMLDPIMSRQEINSRYYENNRDLIRNRNRRHKYYSICHIALLEQRINDIIDGQFNDLFPSKPIEPSAYDLANPLSDSRELLSRYEHQVNQYHDELERLKRKLSNINTEDILQKVNEKMALEVMNVADDTEEEHSVLTNASTIDSSEAESTI